LDIPNKTKNTRNYIALFFSKLNENINDYKCDICPINWVYPTSVGYIYVLAKIVKRHLLK